MNFRPAFPAVRPGPFQSLRPRSVGVSLALLLGLILSACGDGSTGPQVATVQISGASEPLIVGQSRQLIATPRDQNGNAIQGLTATWSGSSAQVAAVSSTGLVSGVSVGSIQITASIGSVSGTANLQVIPAPVASVSLSVSALQLKTGESVTLIATLRDAQGNILEGRTVTWSSSASGVASVSSSGEVLGVTSGNATITAASEGRQANATVTVTSATAPIVSGITPSPMREGEEAVISGTGFSSTSQSNVVLIDGKAAQVLEAGPTSLRVLVPTGQCTPEGPTAVTVSVGGETSSPFTHPFLPAATLSMQVGEFRRIAFPEDLCVRLSATGANEEYLIGLQSTTATASSVTLAQFAARTGTVVGASPAAAAPDDFHPPLAVPGAGVSGMNPLGSSSTASPDRWAQHRQAEGELRRREEAALRARGLTPSVRSPALTAADGPSGVPADAQPGELFPIRVPDLSEGMSTCEDFNSITAVVRKVGSGSIWLEDVQNPAGGFSDGELDALSDEFDGEILPEISDYFGAPTDFDENGRVVIVITRQVNRTSNALAFVTSADFFPDFCPAANGGEYYYARAPDPSGADGPAFSTADALELAPILLAHEVTHVIQFGRRIQADASTFPTIWELEGQATFAEEIAGFRLFNRSPGQNYGFDVAFNSPPIGDVDWHRFAFTDLALYYGFQSPTSQSTSAPHGCGWFGREANGPCASQRLIYGVTWSFLRWLSDHYGDEFAGGERELHRRLVEHSLSGFATFESIIGEPMPVLLAFWAASLYTDERVTPLDPRLTWPSWDLRSIDNGLVETAHLNPRQVGYTFFSHGVSVAAGSSAYFRLSGGNRPPTAVRARTGSEEVLAPHMQLWIVRMR